MVKKKRAKNMEELTKNFDEFMKGKEYNEDGKEKFEKTIKKPLNKKR